MIFPFQKHECPTAMLSHYNRKESHRRKEPRLIRTMPFSECSEMRVAAKSILKNMTFGFGKKVGTPFLDIPTAAV